MFFDLNLQYDGQFSLSHAAPLAAAARKREFYEPRRHIVVRFNRLVM
jgi:hypothetical protein